MSRSFVVDDTLGFLRVARKYVLRPAGPSLPIAFRLARDARVSVRVETPAGTAVRSFPVLRMAPGEQVVAWDGRRRGVPVTAGRYVVRVVAISPLGRSELTAPVEVRLAP